MVNKLPITQAFLIAAGGYLAYIYYQGSGHQQLVRTRNLKSDPIELFKSSHKNLMNANKTQDLIHVYQYTGNYMNRYMVHPLTIRNLVKDYRIDLNGKNIQKNTEVYVNHYLRSKKYEEGNFYTLFWTNWINEHILFGQPANIQLRIAKQQVDTRNKYCQTVSAQKQSNNQMAYVQCIRKTQPYIQSIKQQIQVYQLIKNSPALVKNASIAVIS